MGLLRVLQPDLRTLSFEAKKRHPAIKEAAEAALFRLRAIEEKFPDSADDTSPSSPYVIAASEEIIQPFLLACDSKNLKLVAVAISSVQKLISRNAVAEGAGRSAVHVTVNDEAVLLKLLQALVTLMSSRVKMHGKHLATALSICFLLNRHKNPVIVAGSGRAKSSSCSVDTEISAVKCKTVASEDKEPSTTESVEDEGGDTGEHKSDDDEAGGKDEEEVCIPDGDEEKPSATETDATGEEEEKEAARETSLYLEDAVALASDLCNLVGGEQPEWLKQNVSVPASFGLDLVESMMKNSPQLFRNVPSLTCVSVFEVWPIGRPREVEALTLRAVLVLKDKICPLIIKSFKMRTTFPPVVRTLRTMTRVVLEFSDVLVAECEVFLSRLIRLLRVDNPLWIHAAVLEVFGELFSHDALISHIFCTYDRNRDDDPSGQIFNCILQTEAFYIQKTFESSVSDQAASFTGRILDMVNQNSPPNVPLSYVESVATSSLCALVSSFEVMSCRTPESDETPNVIGEMMNSAWPSLLGSLSCFLGKESDASKIKAILECFTKLIRVCCNLSLETPRDAFLTLISNTTLPSWHTIDQQSKDGATKAPVAAQQQQQRPLTEKNVLAVQSMMSIGRTMGDVLESGWVLVLECCEKLDHLMKVKEHLVGTGSGGAAGSASASGGAAKNPTGSNTSTIVGVSKITTEQAAMLYSGLDAIFNESVSLERAGFYYLVVGLCRLSELYLNSPHFAANARLSEYWFALERLVHVVTLKVERLHIVWDPLVDHLRSVCNHTVASVRELGVKAEAELITSAFAYHSEQTPGDEGGEDGPDTSGDPTPSPSRLDAPPLFHMQTRLLEALEELSHSSYADTRSRTLECMHAILQSSGQAFSQGWPLVLSILMTVAVNDDAPHISIAFKSIHLICLDFLDNLPLDCLALFITTIGCYGLQGSDINISLTATGLLQRVAEFLIKEGEHIECNNTTLVGPADGEDLKESTSSANANSLWMTIFTEFEQLCMDQRYEARTCAVRTLCKTLQVHGAALDIESVWVELWEKILFPILEKMRSAAAAAASEEVDVELGKQGGRTVRLLVHHSRNNAQKQWSETCTLALSGVVRLMVSLHGTIFAKLPNFDTVWSKLWKVVGLFAVSTSDEVSQRAIRLMQELISVTARSDMPDQLKEFREELERKYNEIDSELSDSQSMVKPRIVVVEKSLWKCALSTYEEVAHALTDHQNSIVTLANSLLEVRHALRSFLDSEDVFLLLRVFAHLSTCAMPTTEGELSPVQRTVLDFFSGIPPVEDESIMTAVFQQLLTIIAKAAGCEYPCKREAAVRSGVPKDRAAASGISKMNETIPSPKHFPLAENAAQVLVKLYLGDAAVETRAAVFRDCVSVLRSAMLIKYVTFHTDLWRVAAAAFTSIVEHGIKALEPSGVFEPCSDEFVDPGLSACWLSVIETCEQVLLHDRSSLPKLSPQELKEEAELDVSLVKCIVENVTPWTRSNGEAHKRVVTLLSAGSEQFCINREGFGQACYAGLFTLCARGAQENGPCSDNIAVASACLPVLVELSKTVLKRFVEDDRKAGKMPLPRTRLAEVSAVLQQLIALELDPRLSLSDSRVQKSTSSKRHLLLLFPLLCDCITTREDGFKILLKDLFHMVARELGLE